MRENFLEPTKRTLAQRVGHKCSNPTCQKPTAGPHHQADRSINVGVAAHITAAASRGPRYQPDMPPEQRISAENGIWLCQVCAKLIDSDIDSFPISVLRKWKHRAEDAARRGISEAHQSQIDGWHVFVPVLSDVAYHLARRQLMQEGWQPVLRPMSNQNSVTCEGNTGVFTNLDYPELVTASPTGYAFCLFKFQDMYRNVLHVVTAGEEIPEQGSHAKVISWRVERQKEALPPLTTGEKPLIFHVKINGFVVFGDAYYVCGTAYVPSSHENYCV